MASYCQRCKQQVHSTAEHQPHLCADIQKRLERRNRQVQAVIDILVESSPRNTEREVAEAIVQKLSQLGVAND